MKSIMRSRDPKLLIGTLAVVGTFAVSVLVFSALPQRFVQQRSTATVTATFKTAGRLAKGMPVRVDGVDVGLVGDIERVPGGARVTMRVKRKAMPLYRDARAGIRWRTVLGGNHYVDLDPGLPVHGELPSNAITLAQTDSQMELDEVLSTFQPGAREGLRTMLDEAPRAFSDPGAPRAALHELGSQSRRLGEGLAPLRGERRDADLRDLVRNTARLVRAADAPRDGIRRLIQGGAGTVTVSARRRQEIEASIERAARVLPDVSATMRQLSGTLALADPVVDRLRAPAGDVAPTLRRLRPTVIDADALLQRARPLLASLSPSVRALARFAAEGRPLLDALEPSLERVDERILPDLAKRDKGTKRTTYEMIGPSVASLNAVAAAFDGTAHIVNLSPQIGQGNIDSLPCKTYLGDPTTAQLVQCEALKHMLANLTPSPPRARRTGR